MKEPRLTGGRVKGIQFIESYRVFSSNENVNQKFSVLGSLINLSTYVHLVKAWTVDPFEIFLGALVSCWLERPCNLYIKLYVEIKLPKLRDARTRKVSHARRNPSYIKKSLIGNL